MLRNGVNFGAALAVTLLVGCSSASSSSATADSATAQFPRKLNAPDPLVVAADRARIAGDSTARTWVVVASDFQCPFCREWHAQGHRRLVEEYVRTGKIRLAYINFPLQQHRNAVPTANAAMCAGAQGRFWEYHDALFQTQQRWASMENARPVLDSIARGVGIDKGAWAQCLESRRMIPMIEADRDRALRGGVQSTPTFLVGGRVYAGAAPFESVRAVIDSAILRDARPQSP